MSVLYIGPYRQTDINGQVSRFFLNSIIEDNCSESVVSRPIYTKPSGGLLSANIVFNTERSPLSSSYDLLVQHMPIEHMQYMPDIATNHYAFPIIDSIENFGLYQSNLKILDYFDKVFVQSEKEKSVLQKYTNNLEIFSPEISLEEFKKITQQKFQFANYDTTKKIYFIGNIDSDENIIKKIIFSIYASTAKHFAPPICIFFLDFYHKPNITLLDNEIKQIRTSFGLPADHTKEIFIFKHFSESELIVAHGSCDIYLSLNDSQTHYLHEKYASLCNNTIISLDNVYDSVMPYKNDICNYAYGMSRRYVSTNKLISIFKEII